MRHQVRKAKLGTDKDHTTALLRNLAMSVIINEKVQTTERRARYAQPFVERLITIGKTKETRESIRLITSLLQHESSCRKILEVLKDRYKDKESGFTRITKIKNRKGDNAQIVQIELT